MKKLKSILLIIIIFVLFASCISYDTKDNIPVDRLPSIFPDYSLTIIPPNIAPLNFYIKEKGTAFVAKIYGKYGIPFIINSKEPLIYININKWRKLLKANTNNEICFEIYVRNEHKQWLKFKTIANKVSQENIENYLVYRLINTGYVLWKNLGIFQRNIENFDESPVFVNSSVEEACVNCHSFCNCDPKKMILHLRLVHPGTLLVNGNKLSKINTKTNFTMSAGVYPSWHPNGKLIAFSVNIIGQNFTSSNLNRIEVSDKASDIVVYNIENNKLTTSPKISSKCRENLPNWSPDGKWLYFISAPEAKDLETRIYAKYELLRISYNPDSNKWGDVDTVLSSRETGKSISFPKISPDGRFLIFCMSDYGYFTIHHASTDLYILDLKTRKYHILEMNSDKTESYHTWSSTGKWFVFASKRLDGLFSRPYFCYIDNNGKAYKPFVLPQKNPYFYDSFLKNYNIPELIKSEINIRPNVLRDLAYMQPQSVKFDSTVDIDALSGATKITRKK